MIKSTVLSICSLNKFEEHDPTFGFINCPPRLRCCRGWGRGWGWNREQNALGWFAWLYKKSKKSCFLMAFSYFNIRTRSVQVQDALRPWKIFFRRDWSLESLLIQKVLIQKNWLNRWFDLCGISCDFQTVIPTLKFCLILVRAVFHLASLKCTVFYLQKQTQLKWNQVRRVPRNLTWPVCTGQDYLD